MPEYFSLSELRALPDMASDTKYPDERVEAAASEIVALIEREVGTSFVERTVTRERYDGGRSAIVLKTPFARSIIAATEDDVAVTDQLLVDSGVLYRLSGGERVLWSAGVLNVVVTYKVGYSDEAPADVKEQALQGTRMRLLETAATNWATKRQTSVSTEQGVVGYVIAGGDRPSGYPDLDSCIVSWRDRLNVFGFA